MQGQTNNLPLSEYRFYLTFHVKNEQIGLPHPVTQHTQIELKNPYELNILKPLVINLTLTVFIVASVTQSTCITPCKDL